MDYPTQPYWHAPPPPRRSPWSTVGAAAALVAVVVVTVAGTKILSDPPRNPSTTITTTTPTVTVTQQAAPTTPPPAAPATAPPAAPPPMCVMCFVPTATPAPNPYYPPPDPEAEAVEQLSGDVNDDAPFVSDVLSGHWVAQLSSKQVGTIDDGKQYDDQSILNEYLGLRANYGAKLLTKSGYWVTVAPFVFTDKASANDWCSSVGRKVPDHCFGTLLK